MKKSPFHFKSVLPQSEISPIDWQDWRWQMRQSLKTQTHFSELLDLSVEEGDGFSGLDQIFRVQTTPYYAALIDKENPICPIRQMILPNKKELIPGFQQMTDPLGENKKQNRPCARLIHRYTDRALFLVTDMCGVYCRYCTRKHFTASDQVAATTQQVAEVVAYLKSHPEIKEVIFSGGDPLTLSNNKLESFLERIYSVETVELIRIGSRMPVACPMRIDQGLLKLFQKYKPIYLMTHFNHPDELTLQAAEALENCVDHGVPVMNQLVLLNGINNSAALIYALNRRLLYLRVKPYYMFQADPSLGTDHLRTSIEDSLNIQKQLWGRASGLSMPTYIVDIPDGGGKAALSPNFQVSQQGAERRFEGWDGVRASYVSPSPETCREPLVDETYRAEWQQLNK